MDSSILPETPEQRYLEEFINFLRLEATKRRLLDDEVFDDFRFWEPIDIIDSYSNLYRFAIHSRYDLKEVMCILPYIMTSPPLELWDEGATPQQIATKVRRHEFVHDRYFIEIPKVLYAKVTLEDFAEYISWKTYYLVEEWEQKDCNIYDLSDIETVYQDLCAFAREKGYSLSQVMHLYPNLVAAEYLPLPGRKKVKSISSTGVS